MWTCARSPSYLYSQVNGWSANLSRTCSRQCDGSLSKGACSQEQRGYSALQVRKVLHLTGHRQDQISRRRQRPQKRPQTDSVTLAEVLKTGTSDTPVMGFASIGLTGTPGTKRTVSESPCVRINTCWFSHTRVPHMHTKVVVAVMPPHTCGCASLCRQHMPGQPERALANSGVTAAPQVQSLKGRQCRPTGAQLSTVDTLQPFGADAVSTTHILPKNHTPSALTPEHQDWAEGRLAGLSGRIKVAGVTQRTQTNDKEANLC